MDDGGESIEVVESIAREVLGSPTASVRRALTGFGNDSWELEGGDGRSYVLKIGPASSAAKWRSSHEAMAIARSAGVPVPQLVHAGESGRHLVRVLTWVDGTSAADAALDEAQEGRFIASLGAAVGALHQARAPGFSSRIDGSAPSFARWRDYLMLRMGQIRARCAATASVESALVERVGAEVEALAASVDDVCEPVVCHRDLHLGNLIVAADGTLAGIVDWDAAEPWDRAGDWFKLEYEVLRRRPERADDLLAAYLDGSPAPSHWRERRRVVHLIEALNTLPNAGVRGWHDEFADRAREHLFALLAEPR